MLTACCHFGLSDAIVVFCMYSSTMLAKTIKLKAHRNPFSSTVQKCTKEEVMAPDRKYSTSCYTKDSNLYAQQSSVVHINAGLLHALINTG